MEGSLENCSKRDTFSSACISSVENGPAEQLALKDGALGRLINRFSSLRRLIRVTAFLLRLKRNLRERIASTSIGQTIQKSHIDAQEYDEAFLALIALAQRQEFPGIVEALSTHPYHQLFSGKHGSSLQILIKPLIKYCPFVGNGVMRIGGRLQRSNEPYDLKHPIILPRNSHLTSLIILHYHGWLGSV